MKERIQRIFDIERESGRAYYLGYDLCLTPDEFLILSAMLEKDSDVSDAELLQRISPEKEITLGNLAVHVCNINRKALDIGGRRLISKRKHHYIFEAEI